MGSYSIFLLIFGVIPLIQCALTPGEIRSSMNLAKAKTHGLAINNIMISEDADTMPPTQLPNPETHTADIISFEDFITIFNKTFENEAEAQKRRGIFQNNVKKIEEHNKLYESGESSYRMGVNLYSDMTHNEVFGNPHGFNESDFTQGHTRSTTYYDPIDLGKEPTTMDWVKKGKVNPIRSQGYAGTCWAFASTASIESAIAIRYEYLQELSEQYLIECDSGNNGCAAGYKAKAIDYVIDYGIAFRNEYPYTAKNGTCKYKPSKTSYHITSKHIIRSEKDNELLNACAHTGPILVSIYASNKFLNYKSGFFEDEACTANVKTNHAVLVVGYGTMSTGKKYWLIRNSHGTGWGEGGYMKMSREKTNHCRISSYALFPSGAERFWSSTVILIFSTFSCIMINKIRAI